MANTPNYNNSIKFNEMSDENGNIIGSIGSIYITGAGFVNREFKGVGIDSQFGWEEMVWYKSPTRTKDFSFKNIDDINVGLVARCEINIKYMDIDDFMALRKIVARQRHFEVTFFNVDEGKWITRDMYCSESSRSKLFTLKQSLIGVLDCSIKLVGTNLDLKTIISPDGTIRSNTKTVTYHLNGGSGTTPTTQSELAGTQIQIADIENIVAPSGKHFKYWSTMQDGTITGSYRAGQSLTLWNNMVLYAQWEDA
jgi:hypothetical protein